MCYNMGERSFFDNLLTHQPKEGAMENVRPAIEGQIVQTKAAGEQFVHASCGGNGGRWYCCTHDKSFQNQFEKDTHIQKGKHQLAWICLEHGLEVP